MTAPDTKAATAIEMNGPRKNEQLGCAARWYEISSAGAGFALERADLVEKRIKAHCLRLGLKSLPIAVVAATLDLIKADSVKRVIATMDQGAVFANVQRVKDVIGAHVAIIGHTGKDLEKGARGSNAILGDVGIMVEISGDPHTPSSAKRLVLRSPVEPATTSGHW